MAWFGYNIISWCAIFGNLLGHIWVAKVIQWSYRSNVLVYFYWWCNCGQCKCTMLNIPCLFSVFPFRLPPPPKHTLHIYLLMLIFHWILLQWDFKLFNSQFALIFSPIFFSSHLLLTILTGCCICNGTIRCSENTQTNWIWRKGAVC